MSSSNQEIYKDNYTLRDQVILRNKLRLRLVYSWLLECCFLLKIGVTRATFLKK